VKISLKTDAVVITTKTYDYRTNVVITRAFNEFIYDILCHNV